MVSVAPHTEGGELPYFRETRPTTPPGTLPAILIHRAGGSSRDWVAQLDEIASRRRVLALDLPGHGLSPGPAANGIREMSLAVARLLDRVDLGKVVVVGHSMGGALSLEMTLLRPDLVAAVVLVASGARLRVAQPVLTAVREHFDALPQLMGRTMFAEETPTAVVEAELEKLFDAPADVVLSDLEACHRFDVEERLAQIKVPVSVLVGKEDFLTPPRLGRRLVERVADGRIRVVERAGHLLPVERPEIVTSAILEATRLNSENEEQCLNP